MGYNLNYWCDKVIELGCSQTNVGCAARTELPVINQHLNGAHGTPYNMALGVTLSFLVYFF